MKFYCDACNTKYAISDDKVRGKVLKVRCKSCGNIITVREHKAPQTPSSSSSQRPSSPRATDSKSVPQKNWHYAINGESSGPFSLAGLQQKFATGQIGDESYVWHDTFDGWKPVREVEAFAESLAQGQKERPRKKTLGFSGEVKAVKAPGGPSRQRSGEVPQSGGAQGPQAGSGQRTPEAGRSSSGGASESSRPSVRKERLQKLRDRLRAQSKKEKEQSATAPVHGEAEDEEAKKSAPKPEPTPSHTDEEPDSAPTTTSSSNIALPTPERRDSREEPAEPLESAMPTMVDQPGPTEPASPEFAYSDTASSETASSETAEPSASGLPPRPNTETSSTSDILHAGDELVPERPDLEADDDAVPFFPEAPKLEGSSEAVDRDGGSQVSGSLLIQIGNIQKKNRGKFIFGAVAAVLILGGAVAVAIYMASQNPTEEPDVAEASGAASDDQDDELVIRRYSKDEHNKFATLELDDVRIGSEAHDGEESEPAKEEEEKPTKKAKDVAAKPAAKEPPRPTAKEPSRPTAKEPPRPTAKADDEEEEEGASAEETTPTKVAAKTANTGEKKKGRRDILRSVAEIRSQEVAVRRPDDPLAKKKPDGKKKLTREQAVAGFKKIARSVRLCRERHLRRGGSLDPKIFVTIEVQPDGEVTSFRTEPSSLKSTEFGRCMQSHKGRWRFAAYGGDPTKIRRRFIVQ